MKFSRNVDNKIGTDDNLSSDPDRSLDAGYLTKEEVLGLGRGVGTYSSTTPC